MGGWGARLYDKYPRKADVINRGFSGYTTRWCSQIKSVVSDEFRKGMLNIVTLWLGANDAVLLSSGRRQFVDIGEYKASLQAIVDHVISFAKEKNFTFKLILFTPPPVSEEMVIENQKIVYKEDALPMSQRALPNTELYAKTVVELYEEKYADNENVYILELFDSLMEVDNWSKTLFDDGLHFCPFGNQMIFERLEKVLESIPALKDFDEIPYQYPWHNQLEANGTSLIGKNVEDLYEHEILILENGFVWDWEQIKFVVKNVVIDKDTERLIDPYLFNSFKVNFKKIEQRDYSGKVILPGLVDAHMHVEMLGTALNNLSLGEVKSLKELKMALRVFSNRKQIAESKAAIVGFGWDNEKFLQDSKRLPTKEMLDEICPNKPVLLNRVCIHIGCANSKALEIAKALEASKRGIAGGEFDVDENGNLTGIVRENALGMVGAALEEYNKGIVDMEKTRERNILAGLRWALSFGLTTLNTNDKLSFDIYKRLDDSNQLPLRVNLVTDNSEVEHRKPYVSESKMFKNTRVKFFSDGSLGSGTAAIKGKSGKKFIGLEKNQGLYKGLLLLSDEEFRKRFKLATDEGYQLEVHCIGDASAEQVVLAMQDVLGDESRARRPQITHCQILSPSLISRMAQMGVVGNLQPSFVPTDTTFLSERLENDREYFGYDRLEYSYCWNSMIKSGIPVTGSSDAPVESVNPLKGMFDAMIRPTSHCFEEDGLDLSNVACFLEKEKLHFSQALHLYTASAHFGSFDEMNRGRIEHDYFADLSIFNIDDISLIEKKDYASLLRSCVVHEVWINGEEMIGKHKDRLPQKRKLNGLSCC